MAQVLVPLEAVFFEAGNYNLQKITCVVEGERYNFGCDWWVRVRERQ